MSRRDDIFRDEALAQRLRRALDGEHAPEAWVQRALRVPAEVSVVLGPRRVSPIAGLVPHLSGLALLLGLIVAIVLQPEALGSIGKLLMTAMPSVPLLFDGVPHSLLLAMLSTPVLLYVLYQGVRGFPVLHRRSAHG